MSIFTRKKLAYELVPSADPKIRSVDSLLAKL
jgi:hypothetical protein